jgi:hypothetical protein
VHNSAQHADFKWVSQNGMNSQLIDQKAIFRFMHQRPVSAPTGMVR